MQALARAMSRQIKIHMNTTELEEIHEDELAFKNLHLKKIKIIYNFSRVHLSNSIVLKHDKALICFVLFIFTSPERSASSFFIYLQIIYVHHPLWTS